MRGSEITARLKKLGAAAEATRKLADGLLPKEAVVVGGKYDGRLGKVTGAILWSEGGLLIGFYVYKATRKGQPVNREVLNSDNESRRYRRVDELRFLDQMEMNV